MFSRVMNFTLAWVALGTMSGAIQAGTAHLVVREVSGAVTIQLGEKSQAARVGLAFDPPAEVRTAAGAMVVIADAETTIRISGNSIVAIPASAKSSSMVDRILQRAGSVLYDVNSRKGRPFAVETPLLTSVVKGTLFSIDAQPGATAVALLEGSLEVTGNGVDAPVMLAPGETARRREGERHIGVEKRATANVVPSQPRAPLPQPAGFPDVSMSSGTQFRAFEDLAQITASIGLASPVEPAAGVTPGPSPSLPIPSSPAPPASDPTQPPSSSPSTPAPSGEPAPGTPVVETPGTVPPVVTAPPVTSPPVAGAPTDEDGGSNGGRKGRARGHEQGHGKGNDERDSESGETP